MRAEHNKHASYLKMLSMRSMEMVNEKRDCRELIWFYIPNGIAHATHSIGKQYIRCWWRRYYTNGCCLLSTTPSRHPPLPYWIFHYERALTKYKKSAKITDRAASQSVGTYIAVNICETDQSFSYRTHIVVVHNSSLLSPIPNIYKIILC